MDEGGDLRPAGILEIDLGEVILRNGRRHLIGGVGLTDFGGVLRGPSSRDGLGVAPLAADHGAGHQWMLSSATAIVTVQAVSARPKVLARRVLRQTS